MTHQIQLIIPFHRKMIEFNEKSNRIDRHGSEKLQRFRFTIDILITYLIIRHLWTR